MVMSVVGMVFPRCMLAIGDAPCERLVAQAPSFQPLSEVRTAAGDVQGRRTSRLI